MGQIWNLKKSKNKKPKKYYKPDHVFEGGDLATEDGWGRSEIWKTETDGSS